LLGVAWKEVGRAGMELKEVSCSWEAATKGREGVKGYKYPTPKI
jgi:hypothetical protein